LRSLLVHANDFFGRDDLYVREERGRRMIAQLGADRIFLANELNVDVVAAGGENRALDFWLRSTVRTHGIDGNDSTHRWMVGLRCIRIAWVEWHDRSRADRLLIN
jgi:hypothetical protein